MSSKKKEDLTFICPFCKKIFGVRGGLRYHLYQKQDPCHARSPANQRLNPKFRCKPGDLELAEKAMQLNLSESKTKKGKTKSLNRWGEFVYESALDQPANTKDKPKKRVSTRKRKKPDNLGSQIMQQRQIKRAVAASKRRGMYAESSSSSSSDNDSSESEVETKYKKQKKAQAKKQVNVALQRKNSLLRKAPPVIQASNEGRAGREGLYRLHLARNRHDKTLRQEVRARGRKKQNELALENNAKSGVSPMAQVPRVPTSFNVDPDDALRFQLIGGNVSGSPQGSPSPSPIDFSRSGSPSLSGSTYMFEPIGNDDRKGRSSSSSSQYALSNSPAPDQSVLPLPSYQIRKKFKPTYTHQVFAEDIPGYRELKIMLSFTKATLKSHIGTRYVAKLKNAAPIPLEKLTTLLPEDAVTHDPEVMAEWVEEDKDWTPPGKFVTSYTVDEGLSSKPVAGLSHTSTVKKSIMRGNNDGDFYATSDSYKLPNMELVDETVTFEIYIAPLSDPKMKEYHRRIQFFILFFINKSSYINEHDNTWEIMILMEKRVRRLKKRTTSTMSSFSKNPIVEEVSYSFVGYLSLYKFLHYELDNWRLRVSQVLILAPFQRQGHGQMLLSTVYNIARERNYSEVNVEDPSPAFQYLRDFLDIKACHRHGFFCDPDLQNRASKGLVWDSEYADEVATALRITKAQVRRCYEIYKLASITGPNQLEADMKLFRVDVKKRLMFLYEEQLAILPPTHTMKMKLHSLYSELESTYMNLVRRAKRGKNRFM